MKRLLTFIFVAFMSVSSTWAGEIFMPTDDCYPDPVLDSITIQDGRIYVEDHVITSGEMSYLMHKVNQPLYEKQKAGQKIYLISMGGIFLGTAAICTGNYWIDNFTGSRKRAGRALFSAGIPVTVLSAGWFTFGVAKAHKAKKQFLRNCFGLSYVENVNVGAGLGSLHLGVTF